MVAILEKVDDDTMQDFLIWLSGREDDIADGVEDFGALRNLFHQLVGRNAGEPESQEPLW